ncbi:reverse transcriptase domain-containing protein [Tanacetum coccineum]
MMRVTTSFLKGEVAASSHGQKKSLLPWKKRDAGDKQNFKKRGFKNQQRSKWKPDRFLLLAKTPNKSLALEKGNFKAPPPMGYSTDECMQLRKQIEEMIKAGKLSHRVAKQRITQSFSLELAISFPSLGEEDGTEGPMIIEAEMGGHFVHRMYVDGGSASKILYKHCFSRLWPEANIAASKNRRHGTLNFCMDELHARKVAISIQWNHWQTKSKKDSIRPINSSWNVKVPGRRRSGNTTNSRIILLECAMVSRLGAQQPVIDQDEVEKLVDVEIMKEVHYHMWLSNLVMVKKHDLENVHRFQRFKQSMPQRRISAAKNRLLKNAEATFQCLADNALQKQISWNLKVYVDDIVIKSHTEKEIIRDMEETFRTIQEINMKLNPKKCTFGMREGMFLGYKVYADGLKVCPDKVDAVLSLPSPKSLKDVQRLESQLYTNEEIGIGPSKCQQAAKDILPGTYDYRDNESTDKADTVKSRASGKIIFGRTMEEEGELPEPWILFTDGSSCIDGFGAGSILTNPKGMEFTYALRFRFEATNNEAEYEALISGSWNK